MSNLASDTCNKNLSSHHTFDIHLASKLGSCEQAIFIHHISYWLQYNERMKRNFHENRYWTYQTFEELHAHFPYWTIKQLRLIIDKLVKNGVVIKGNFNSNKYDHTIWYSIDYEKVKSICPNGQIEKTEWADRTDQMGKSSYTDNKPDNKTYTSKEDIAPTSSKQSYDITFDLGKFCFEGIKQRDLDSWKELYPTVNIPMELKRMEEWVMSNPVKAKSKKKWRQFINNWLRENNEKNINKEAYKESRKNDSSDSPSFEENKAYAQHKEKIFESSIAYLNVGNKDVDFVEKKGGICNIGYGHKDFIKIFDSQFKKYHKR